MTEAQVAHIMALVDRCALDMAHVFRADSMTVRERIVEKDAARAAVEAALRDAPTQASQPVARPGAEPVAAQQRFRHPQKTMPGWSPWQLCKPATRPAWEVDSEGYEVEYRALYTAPPQTSHPLFADLIAQHAGLREEMLAEQASQPLTDGELLFHYNTAGGLLSSLRAVQEAILSVNGAAQKGKP